MSTTGTDSGKRDNTTPSCKTCNRRKVKCDRITNPCAPCRKSGLECTFPEPARKRARRKPPTSPPDSTPGALRKGCSLRKAGDEHGVSADGQTRRVFGGIGYVFTGDISTSPDNGDSMTASLAADTPGSPKPLGFTFHARQRTMDDPIRLSAAQSLVVWKAYKEYVDPVTKVFHCDPNFAFLDRGRWGEEAIDLTRPSDACLFHVVCFATSVATEGNVPGASFPLQGDRLTRRFRQDAEDSLRAISFITTREIRVLQALVLYLIALQSVGDDETVWSMLGVAIRVASVLGMPHDIGFQAPRIPLSVYQLEIRRRVWWAIIALDARVTRLLGRTGFLSHNFIEIPRPANVDDTDFYPSLTEMPPDSTGLTDVSYVRYRATLSDLLPFIYATGNAEEKCKGLIEMIEDAERQIEDQFVQHCDMINPMHLIVYSAGRGYVKRVKLAMYSIYPNDPALSPGQGQGPYASEAFWLAKDSMDLFLMTWTEPGLKPWQWHWKCFFGWHTYQVLIQEISRRSSSQEALEAWAKVKKIARLVVSALKLKEGKARLVGDLRMLIEAGDVRSPPDSAAPLHRASGSMVRGIRPGMGTNPHNAMFPGLTKSFTLDSDNGRDGAEGEDGEMDDGNVKVDLKAINWMELDRLLVQLGKYSST